MDAFPPADVISDHDGARAVRTARRAIARALGAGSEGARDDDAGPSADPPLFAEPRGVFVTLRRSGSGALRGCVGYPLPTLPLRSAVERAAVAAAQDDPRFPPVRATELSGLTVEVSVLTVPQAVPRTSPEELVRAIRVGRDGLIVDGFGASGLLLPQVATEERWEAEEFLDRTCEKAGLPTTAWRDPRVVIRSFRAEVFSESAPGGDVVRFDPGITESGGRSGPGTRSRRSPSS